MASIDTYQSKQTLTISSNIDNLFGSASMAQTKQSLVISARYKYIASVPNLTQEKQTIIVSNNLDNIFGIVTLSSKKQRVRVMAVTRSIYQPGDKLTITRDMKFYAVWQKT